MRADRLVATLLLLQARGRVTAAGLAQELEISVATARRDLEALSAAGIPVYPQSGRGGGWQLLGGSRTDLSGLTASEAQSLFLLLGPAASIVPEAKSALRKLVRALPDTFRADAEAAARAVVVDPAGWGAAERDRPPLVDLLQAAVVRRRKVRLGYADRSGVVTERVVDPWGLADKDDVWYLISGTPTGQRTFRVDRMSSCEISDEPGDRPSDFDMSSAWQRVVAEMEQRRSVVTATVLVPERLVRVLRALFGRHCEVLDQHLEVLDPVAGGQPGDGRVRVRVSAHMALSIAEQLAGLGSAVEVVEPDSVRHQLARIGSQLADMYQR